MRCIAHAPRFKFDVYQVKFQAQGTSFHVTIAGHFTSNT